MMTKFKLIVVTLVFFGILALGTGLIAQQKAGGGADQAKGIVPVDPTVKSLIEARIEAASGVYKSAMQRLVETNMKVSTDELPVWSRRWMEEQIRLDPSPVKKVSAIQDHLERTKRLEMIVDQYAKTGQGHFEDPLKMKYFRLEAEQMLAEVRLANPGAPK